MLSQKVYTDKDGTFTYVGVAASSALTSEPRWHIVKLEHDAVGNFIGMTHSGGVEEQIFVWDDRKTIEYK